MKKILLLVCALPLFCSAVYASGSRGIPQDNYTRPSKSFDVGMIFYKMIGSTPNFEDWIETSKAYKALEPKYQADYKQAEELRLKNSFATLNPKKTAIVIRSVVEVELISPKPKSGQPRKNTLKINLPPDGSFYFPYTLGDQSIAVIPNGVDLYREVSLTDPEVKAIRSRLNVNSKATLVLEIVPTMADGKRPMILDETPYWLLIGEIGFIGLYNDYTEVLWSYHAPAYVMQGQDSLLELRSNSIIQPNPTTVPVSPGK